MMSRGFRLFAAIALTCMTACSSSAGGPIDGSAGGPIDGSAGDPVDGSVDGSVDDVDLTGRWEGTTIEDPLEFFPDGRFITYKGGDESNTDEGTYTARDGILALTFEEEPDEDDTIISVRLALPFWTDGSTLQFGFASPEHDGDAVVGTWRLFFTRETTRLDGSVETEMNEIVTRLAADGAATQETFLDGVSERVDTGTYTVVDGAILFEWPTGAVRSGLRDRRLGGSTMLRVTAD